MWVNEVHLFLVFFLFFSVAALAYVISDRDILHPFVVISSVIAFSAFMTIMAPIEWHVGISAFACGVALLGLISFGVGSIWVEWHLKKEKTNLPDLKQHMIPDWVLFFLTVGMILFSCYEFKVLYEASLSLGNQNGYSGMIRTVRMAVEAQIYTMPRIIVYGNYFAEAMFCSCAYVFLSRFIPSKEKLGWYNMKYVIPLLVNIPLLILSAARMMLFQRILFFVVLGGILYQRYYGFSLKCKRRIFWGSSLAGVSFLVLFLLFGFFTNKVTLESNPLSVLAHYGGLSLPALSVYLDSTFLETPYVGVSTMQELYRKLSLLGIEVPYWRDIRYDFLPFVYFDGIDTNVYTGLRRYIQDYGIVGMSLIMMLWGMVYTYFYEYARLYAKKGIYIIMYAALGWPLFWFINEEGLLTTVIQTKTIYFFVSVYLFDRFFVKEQYDIK